MRKHWQDDLRCHVPAMHSHAILVFLRDGPRSDWWRLEIDDCPELNEYMRVLNKNVGWFSPSPVADLLHRVAAGTLSLWKNMKLTPC